MGYGYDGENLYLGIPEPEEPEVVGRCVECGDDIYAGGAYYDDSGSLVHEECLFDYIQQHYFAHEVARALMIDRH